MLSFIVDNERPEVRQRHVRTFLFITDIRRRLHKTEIQPVRSQLNRLFQRLLGLAEQLIIIKILRKIIHGLPRRILQ